MPMIYRWTPALLLTSFALILSGCSTIKKTKQRLHTENDIVGETPQVALADQPVYSLEGGAAPLVGGWWRAYNNRDLSLWVQRVLNNNRDAVAALKRLDQANAFLRQQASALFPSLDLRGGVDEVWRDGNINRNGTDEEFFAGVALSYDIDIWQRNKATRDSARALTDASREDLAEIAISVTRRAAELWFTLEENREILKLLRAQVDINQDLYEVLRERQEIGQAGLVDILQQEQQLASVQAQIPNVVAAIQSAGNQLRLLSNQTPNALIPVASAGGLPELPPAPELGSPLDLIEHRPDLRASWARIRSAERDTAVAAAARLPIFSADFGYNFAAREITSLEDSQNANLGANITAPVLDGGRRRATEDRQRAITEERVINFGTDFLGAVNEVENAIRNEQFQLDFIERLTKQADLAGRVAEEAQDQYNNGVGPFITVFNARTAEQSSRRRVVREKANLLRIRAGLYEALGGDWTKELVPEEEHQAEPRKFLGVPYAPARSSDHHSPGHSPVLEHGHGHHH